MATLAPGTCVTIKADCLDNLASRPPADAEILVAVNPSALRARRSNHTQLAAVIDDRIVWAGAMGEDLLVATDGSKPEVRRLLGARMLTGERVWRIVQPGSLLRSSAHSQISTIYMSDPGRPWVVLGALETGDILAAPLNEARNVQWFTPVVGPKDLNGIPGRKESMIELAHLWSFPRSVGNVGSVATMATTGIAEAVRQYFNLDDRK